MPGSERRACPASARERGTQRESGGYGTYSSQAIWCNARGDSTLAKRLSGFTLTQLPLWRLQIGPGSMCFHPARSWGPNTEASQAWRPQQPKVRSESCQCPECTCVIVNSHQHAIHPQQSHVIYISTPSSKAPIWVCVCPTILSYVLLLLWKKNPYQGLFPKVLLRFLFRGYERKPWQAVVFHEVSKQGIPTGVWDLWEGWLIK